MSLRFSSEIGRVRFERLDANTPRLHRHPYRYAGSVGLYAHDRRANRRIGSVARNGACTKDSDARSTVEPRVGGGHRHAIAWTEI